MISMMNPLPICFLLSLSVLLSPVECTTSSTNKTLEEFDALSKATRNVIGATIDGVLNLVDEVIKYEFAEKLNTSAYHTPPKPYAGYANGGHKMTKRDTLVLISGDTQSEGDKRDLNTRARQFTDAFMDAMKKRGVDLNKGNIGKVMQDLLEQEQKYHDLLVKAVKAFADSLENRMKGAEE